MKVKLLLLSLTGAIGLAAGPLIIGAPSATCAAGGKLLIGVSVCVQLNADTYNFFGKGADLVYEFTNTSNSQIVTLPGVANNQKPCFKLPAGTYQLVIKTKPVSGVGQSTSVSYSVIVPPCKYTGLPSKDRGKTIGPFHK